MVGIYYSMSGFTQWKAEQRLEGIELQEKELEKKLGKALQKEPKDKWCLLTLRLKASKIMGQRKTFWKH